MIKLIKFWTRFIIQLLHRHNTAIILSIIVGAISFLAINQFTLALSRFLPQTKRIGLVGRYHLATLPSRVSHLISYGLTDILPNGRATSSPIISHWTIKGAGREYLFFFKPNIRWQDRQPLTPDQVNYQISGAHFSPIENGIKISLESPSASFPTLLDRPIFRDGKIGLGPYRIKKATISGGNFSSLLLVSVQNRKDRILFRFYPNEKALITAFKLGEVDEIWQLSNIENLSSWKNIVIKTESGVQKYVALFFNIRKSPFSSKRIRQALAYTIQKPAKKDRALGPIAPSSWAYNDKVKTYHFNPKHARKLLEREQWSPEPSLVIKISTLPELIDWAEKIKDDWQKHLNLSGEIYVTNFAPDSDDFDVFLGYNIIPPDPDQYFFWHSTQQGNITGLNSPRIDQLLEKGRKSIDFEERKMIYAEFQRAISEEVPAVFLFYPPNYKVIRK